MKHEYIFIAKDGSPFCGERTYRYVEVGDDPFEVLLKSALPSQKKYSTSEYWDAHKTGRFN